MNSSRSASGTPDSSGSSAKVRDVTALVQACRVVLEAWSPKTTYLDPFPATCRTPFMNLNV